MGALTQARVQREFRSKHLPLPLASGSGMTAFRNGIACIDTSSHTAKPGAAGNANLVPVGEWDQDVDNSAGTASVYVVVNLDKELVARWYDTVTGANAVTAANSLFDEVYIFDDHTVTTASSGNSVAGRVWGVDSIKGVLIEKKNLP